MSERLIGTYRTVLEHLDPDGETASQVPGQGAARAVAAVREAGGFAAQLAGIEEVSAFHGDNYEVLVHRFFRKQGPGGDVRAGRQAGAGGHLQ